MSLTAFYHPVVAPRSRSIRPLLRPVTRAIPKTQTLPNQRTRLIRGLLARLCADPRIVYHRGKARPLNSGSREAWFWLSFDTVRCQLHFPLPASVSSTVELYIEIAYLWPKIKTWDLGSATVDNLVTDLTALLLKFAEADALEKAARKAALAALPKNNWTGMDGAALWARINRQAEHHQGLMELMEESL